MRIGGRLGSRLMIVAVLVLGIVVMHHVARSDDAAAGHQQVAATAAQHGAGGGAVQADEGGSGDDSSLGHSLLHLCLAVLTGAVLLAVAWLVLLAGRRLLPVLWHSACPQAWLAPPRPPPRPYGSALLVSLCVMRT